MKVSKMIIGLVVLMVVTAALPAMAQRGGDKPRVSPNAAVSQTIGVTVVDIEYGRPSVKGRTIWGELVPFDKVWRAGANEATTISFSTDVTINGRKLAAGRYGFFTFPSKGDWIVVFNKVSKQWGSMAYDAEQDAIRVTVTPTAIDNCEFLQYSFGNLTANSAVVSLCWEKIAVSFTVSVE